MKRLAFVVLVLAFAGCGPSTPPGVDCVANPTNPACVLDAGTVDAGPVDAGPIDAGPEDAGPIDAGPIDAGPEDAGPADAGPEDAGPVDAGCGPEFAPCTGGICEGNVCVPACAIGGSALVDGTENPANPCETCQPAVNSTAYSPLAEGASCNADGQHFCSNDVCVEACNISDAGVVDAGLAQVDNACQTCQPVVSVSSYSPLADGTSCDADGQHFCTGGACIGACNIPNVGVVGAGLAQSGNVCETCQPAVNAADYSAVADGTSCNSDGQHYCTGGACISACNIPNVGVVYAGASNSGNDCQSCQPSVNAAGYSNLANGTACNSNGGNVCMNGGCIPGCLISGVHYAAGAVDGTNSCVTCDPSQSVTSWSNAPNSTVCGCGNGGPLGSIVYAYCNGAGSCVTCGGCNGGPPCCGGCNAGRCDSPQPPVCH